MGLLQGKSPFKMKLAFIYAVSILSLALGGIHVDVDVKQHVENQCCGQVEGPAAVGNGGSEGEGKTDEGGTCDTDAGWQLFQGLCFYVSATDTMDWHGARAYCRNLGGDLIDGDNNTSATALQLIESLRETTGNLPFWNGAFKVDSMWYDVYGNVVNMSGVIASEAYTCSIFTEAESPGLMGYPCDISQTDIYGLCQRHLD